MEMHVELQRIPEALDDTPPLRPPSTSSSCARSRKHAGDGPKEDTRHHAEQPAVPGQLVSQASRHLVSTHCQTGTSFKTASPSAPARLAEALRAKAACAPQLGQSVWSLPENACRQSNAHARHRNRANPPANHPPRKKARNAWVTKPGSPSSPAPRRAPAENVSKCSRTTC